MDADFGRRRRTDYRGVVRRPPAHPLLPRPPVHGATLSAAVTLETVEGNRAHPHGGSSIGRGRKDLRARRGAA
jgi:hypothetical protein